MISHIRFVLAAMIVFPLHMAAATSDDRVDYQPLKDRFQKMVSAELDRKIIPGVSVAWVVDGEIVHSAGYGQANWLRGIAASPETIYRAGSISKLFNAVAAMQLVEQGKLDLDAPIAQALPEFRIVDPFNGEVPLTARQMLCHRLGMIREAPVGGYLDSSQATIKATVHSVAECVLVNRPNIKTRYSNVAPTVVGRALEVISGMPYAEYQQRHVLGPLGMQNSAWTMNERLHPHLASGMMRIARGGGFVLEPAPEFELGTIPAGNLYTTASDLARFAAFIMGGNADSPSAQPVLTPGSLEKMFVPQLTKETTGFGLGFSVNRHREHKTVQHMGAVYGFTTSLVVLPEQRIGVIVLSNADLAIAPVKRLSDAALDLLLEGVRKQSIPAPAQAIDVSADSLAQFAGEYESASYWARLEVRSGRLTGELSTQPIDLTPVGPLKFLADSRLMNRSPVDFERAADGTITAFTAAGQRFRRMDSDQVTPAPQDWNKFVGRYGPVFIPLVISIRHGHLYALAENEYDYRLTPLNRVTFRLPPGMYEDEHVVFQTNAEGAVSGLLMANMELSRRND